MRGPRKSYVMGLSKDSQAPAITGCVRRVPESIKCKFEIRPNETGEKEGERVGQTNKMVPNVNTHSTFGCQ